MRTFQQAAAVFCIACIGTELVTLLVGPIRAVRCIKMAAGLYILTVFLSLLVNVPKTLRAAMPGASASVSAASWETVDTQILTRAEKQLETFCTEQCRQKFGVEIQLAVTLEESDLQTAVTRVSVGFPAGCDAAAKQAVLDFLQQELGVLPTVVEETIP